MRAVLSPAAAAALVAAGKWHPLVHRRDQVRCLRMGWTGRTPAL